jgi:4-diphosphocytidyl-2-C-methyl-D-erythritol kinase
LDELAGTALGTVRLEALAARLGSDVPFFIRGVPAVCRGRGEVVEPFEEELPSLELLVVKPPFEVPTAWAYGAFGASEKSRGTFSGKVGSIVMTNDLEPAVFSKFLILPVLKRWLAGRPGVHGAMMSGSGSSVFALVDGGAGEIARLVGREFGSGFSTFACRLARGTR